MLKMAGQQGETMGPWNSAGRGGHRPPPPEATRLSPWLKPTAEVRGVREGRRWSHEEVAELSMKETREGREPYVPGPPAYGHMEEGEGDGEGGSVG